MKFKENHKTALAKILSDLVQCDGIVNQGEIDFLHQVYQVLDITSATQKKAIQLTLADAVITGSSAVGGIAGDNRGTVENCRVINCNITGQTWVGGIAGNNNQCENTENCLVLNTSITYSDTDNCTGGAIIGTQQNCNLNNKDFIFTNSQPFKNDNYGTVSSVLI